MFSQCVPAPAYRRLVQAIYIATRAYSWGIQHRGGRHLLCRPRDLHSHWFSHANSRFVSAAFFHAHDLGLVESRHNENHFENRSTFLNTKPELSIKARERTYSADSQSPTDSCGKRWRAHYEQVSHNRYPSPPRRRLQLDGVKARRRYFFLYERRTGSAVLAQYMRMSDTQTDTHTTLHAPSVAMGHISRIVCVRCAYKHKMAWANASGLQHQTMCFT